MSMVLTEALKRFAGTRKFRAAIRPAFSVDEQQMYIRRVKQLLADAQCVEVIERHITTDGDIK